MAGELAGKNLRGGFSRAGAVSRHKQIVTIRGARIPVVATGQPGRFSRPVVTRMDQGNGSLHRMIIGGPSHGAGDVGEELVRGDALGSRHPL